MPDAQSMLGLQAAESLVRRIRGELSTVGSQSELDLCLSVVSILRTVPVLSDDQRLVDLARPISRARWRVRLVGGLKTLRKISLPALFGLFGLLGLCGVIAGYIGLTVLIQRLYEINLPLAP